MVGQLSVVPLRCRCAAAVALLLTSCGTDPATFVPQGERGVVFHSDWGTATGTSSAARMDEAKPRPWTSGWFDGSSTAVIPVGDSLDFPTENVLANYVSPSGGGGQVMIVERDEYLDPVAVGESLYLRFYRRIVLPDTHRGDQTTHGFHDDVACCSSGNLGLTVTTTSQGTFGLHFSTGYATNDTIAFWSTPTDALRKNQTYRMEFRIHRVHPDSFTLDTRIYDSDERLQLSNRDFKAVGWGAEGDWSLADEIPLAFNSSRGSGALLDWRVGLNGLGGVAGEYPHGYWGAFAICTDDWCGPYEDGM